jgi:tetratricopeptide (TPR) repeat protein
VRAAADWLAVERDNLVRACRHAAGNGWPRHALALALALRPALENGHDDAGLTVLGEALRAAQLSGGAEDPRDLADVQVWLAFTNWRLGRIDVAAAHIQHALDEHTRLAWAEGITHCLALLGAVRYSQGRLADAVDCERRGLEVARRAGNRLQEASQLNNLGWLHLRLDDHPAAAGYYERATRLAEQDGHTPHAAECAVGLAAAYAGLGRYDEALALVEQALIVDVEHDLLPQRVEAMTTTGNIYRLQCSHLDAIEQHTIAFALCRDLDHPALTAIVLTNLGEAHLAAGDHASASDCYRRALDFAAKGGDRIERARAWTGLGDARCAAGEPRQAREYWQQAYHSYLEMGHPTAEHVRARLSAGRLVGQR